MASYGIILAMAGKITLPKGTIVPNHVVIMPDGDRRWARARGLTDSEGHKAGMDNMIKLARVARSWGIHTVSAWGLSTENWIERPEKEIDFLMRGIAKYLFDFFEEMDRDGVKIVHIGRRDRLPKSFLDKIAEIEEKTKNNTKHIFNIGLDYNGWDEIVRATQKIVSEGIPAEKIDRKIVDSHLDTAGQPYPYIDLYIRTSGEQRTSGFMMWQADYAEFYWELEYFPAFTPEKLREAVVDYSRRRRRFGGNDSVEHLCFDPKVTAKLELSWWRLANIPEGTRFRDYAMEHLREQFGLSKALAKEAAKYFIEAIIEEKDEKWDKAKENLKEFYGLIKGEIKLAFEPKIVASMEVDFNREMKSKDSVSSASNAESMATEHLAEVYRISLLQAAKAAHLRVLAGVEKNLALSGMGEEHWVRAEDYLQKYYSALKERVA
jgi:undecaprenyl diphosphate synthase